MGRGRSHCRSRVSLFQWTCKSRKWPGKSRASSSADFPQWRLQRRHNKFPLSTCVSSQSKSVMLQLSDVGARKAFTCSTWFSASQSRRCPVLRKWPWQLQEGLGNPGSPVILCTSLVSCWSWRRSLLHHLKTRQICFNWIQRWSQYWLKLEDSLCVSVHRSKTYLDEEESFILPRGE